jgi:hypothetical protein
MATERKVEQPWRLAMILNYRSTFLTQITILAGMGFRDFQRLIFIGAFLQVYL